MKNAIFSVYNKANIDVLAKFLISKGYNIITSGGTYNHLKKNTNDESSIKAVENITHQPEILGGRVKTLHPTIHGGLLADTSNSAHMDELATYGMQKIDITVVNLYPFERTLENTDDIDELIEQIDIGGHTLIRSTAKNFKSNIILHSPSQYNNFMINYDDIISSVDRRRELATSALHYITDYDISISNYFAGIDSSKNKQYLSLTKQFDFKYGLNPQQAPSAFWSVNDTDYRRNSIPFTVMNGNIGYINMLDAINGWNLVSEIEHTTGKIAAASLKHTSPAGVSIARDFTSAEQKVCNVSGEDHCNLSDCAKAYVLARNVDPKSSFGDFVAISGEVDITLALKLQKEISDGIVAASYTEDALRILKAKKSGNYVILQGDQFPLTYSETKIIGDFAMTQSNNDKLTTREVVENGLANDDTIPESNILDIQIANITLKYSQSNSVCLVKNGTLLGLGCGQQSRIDCVKLACNKALVVELRYKQGANLLDDFRPTVKKQDKINAVIKWIENDFSKSELNEWKSLFNTPPSLLDNKNIEFARYGMNNISLASDGFFPFHDNIDVAAKYGVRYIIQPGGSIKDEDVIKRCSEHRISMILSHIRQFYH